MGSLHSERTKGSILRKYYLENDYFTSTEGVLKGLSILTCTITSIVFIWAGGCSLMVSRMAGGLTLGAGACLAVVAAVNVLSLAAYAPMIWFLCDLIVSTVLGSTLLMLAVLGVVFCNPQSGVAYAYGPLSLLNGGLIIVSTLCTYMAVTSRWDAVSTPTTAQIQQENELDV